MKAQRYRIQVHAVVEYVEKGFQEHTLLSETQIEGTSPPRFEKKHGYTQPIDKTVRKEMQLYEQTVDELDMASLVSVVNKIKGA